MRHAVQISQLKHKELTSSSERPRQATYCDCSIGIVKTSPWSNSSLHFVSTPFLILHMFARIRKVGLFSNSFRKSPRKLAEPLPASRCLMNAETIARALGGRKSGRGWSARCPAHDDSKPSLSLTDSDNGRVLIYCHAGCDQNTVISELKSTGLWTVTGRRPFRRAQSRRTAEPSQPSQDEINRRENALSIWEASEPAQGTPAETYLASRGLKLPPTTRLRFHPHFVNLSPESSPAKGWLVTSSPDPWECK